VPGESDRTTVSTLFWNVLGFNFFFHIWTSLRKIWHRSDGLWSKGHKHEILCSLWGAGWRPCDTYLV
jgi:hypothetical protein